MWTGFSQFNPPIFIRFSTSYTVNSQQFLHVNCALQNIRFHRVFISIYDKTVLSKKSWPLLCVLWWVVGIRPHVFEPVWSGYLVGQDNLPYSELKLLLLHSKSHFHIDCPSANSSNYTVRATGACGLHGFSLKAEEAAAGGCRIVLIMENPNLGRWTLYLEETPPRGSSSCSWWKNAQMFTRHIRQQGST